MSDTSSSGMDGTAAVQVEPRSSRRRLLIATNIGTTLESFDFALFGAVAGLVFPKLFFPALSPFVALLASFLAFGVGLLVRPLGALYFAHRADRVGRKQVLVVSLTMMGLATLGIGLLPGYSTIGVAAPVLLVLLRCVQGFSLGGETGAAAVLTLEHSPPRRRALMNAAVLIGTPIGQILTTFTLLIVRGAVGEAAFLSWAWRIPFLIGFSIAVVGVVIRRAIDESPAFRRAAAQLAERRRTPLATVVRDHPRLLALLTLNLAPYVATYYICLVYFLSYLTANLRLPSSVGFSVLLVGNIVSVLIYLAAGALADRYGRKPVLYAAGLVTVVGAVLYFPLLHTRSWWLILLATVLMLGAIHLATGARTPLIAESFPMSVRSSGFNIVTTVAILIGGSATPSAAAVLLHWSGTPWSIAAAMAATTVLSIAVLPFIPETVDRDIEDS